jgi:plastocyanin
MRKGLVLLAAAGLLLAGCGGTSSSSAQQPAARSNTVDLPPSYQFAPTHIQVASGTTVTWTNHDNFTHSVQVQGQTEVHMMRPGESAQITFSAPGDYRYICTLHTQNMQGTVTVS